MLKEGACIGQQVTTNDAGATVAADRQREDDDDVLGWEQRLIAASRLMLIENLDSAFSVSQAVVDLVSAHRWRAHDIWPKNKPNVRNAAAEECKETKKLMAAYRRRQQQKAKQPSQTTRINSASVLAEVANNLMHPLKAAQGNLGRPSAEMAKMWSCAANPAKRSASGLRDAAGPVDLKAIATCAQPEHACLHAHAHTQTPACQPAQSRAHPSTHMHAHRNACTRHQTHARMQGK